MKKLLLLLVILTAAVLPATAQEVAVFQVKIPKEKKTQQFVIGFHEQEAPATVANFKKLAKKGFYKGTTFHRVFAGTLVQGGDPLSKSKDRSSVGTSGPGYTLEPEIHRKHTAGSVAMARLPDQINPGRRSNGSQFYVTLKPMPELDGQYTVFGEVLSGTEVLDAISRKPADSNDNPVERIVIKSVRIVPREKAGI